ncbi:unnamed protein product [Nyctereutes procyonoides]|uniref:(raccoon dog) hypothetical protein n=1 Tax=Nyctereutes procyonoides TaxID=34880 RepID=A0A811ZRK0_NYCPR|nr:unnamed protein product [Nyctereutes procyonoides]
MAEQVPRPVLLLCLGNICQSLTAETIFKKLVTDQNVLGNWRVHTLLYQEHNCKKKRDTPMNHTVQILCMDESNLRDLNRKSMQGKNGKAKMEPLRNPYYVSDSKLKTVYQQCVRCSVLDKVR